MSKSFGNIYTLNDITEHGFDIEAFKLLALSKHYRTEGNFTWDIMQASQNRFEHWCDIAVLRHQTHSTRKDEDLDLITASQAIIDTLENDLDTPSALAVIDEAFRKISNKSLDEINEKSLTTFLNTINDLLGINLIDTTPDINEEAKQLIIERARAREAKDWHKSDALRDELLSENIIIQDTKGHQVWKYALPDID